LYCCHTIPEIRYFIKGRNLFLKLLEAGKSKRKAAVDSAVCIFRREGTACPCMAKAESNPLLHKSSYKRILIPFTKEELSWTNHL
jgi:hypothetical protein